MAPGLVLEAVAYDDSYETQGLHAFEVTEVEPPDEQSEGLGWRGYKVNALADLAPLLYQFRCW